jgi:hypothetical protein
MPIAQGHRIDLRHLLTIVSDEEHEQLVRLAARIGDAEPGTDQYADFMEAYRDYRQLAIDRAASRTPTAG